MNSLNLWVPRNAKALKGSLVAGEGIRINVELLSHGHKVLSTERATAVEAEYLNSFLRAQRLVDGNVLHLEKYFSLSYLVIEPC